MKPHVAIIIPTLDRPVALTRCLHSVMACEYDNFEVIVADQSRPGTTIRLLDKRLRYIQLTAPGKCRAMNEAVRRTESQILLFTDDDCTVRPNWIERHVELLTATHTVDVVFGALEPAPHDPSLSVIPAFGPPAHIYLKGRWAFLNRGGAGGNLAIRRSVFSRVGLFDPDFGPGAKFPSCEEYDLYCRSLWDGLTAAFDPANPVLHYGERSYADGSAQQLLRGYACGEGAVLGKHLKTGNLCAGAAIPVIAARYTSHAVKSFFSGKTSGASRPLVFLCGAAAALMDAFAAELVKIITFLPLVGSTPPLFELNLPECPLFAG